MSIVPGDMKSDVSRPFATILSGSSNYVIWSQAMCSFLKGRKLWKVVSGDTKQPTADDDIEDWECKNHQIITWFRNTCVSSIYEEFGYYDNAKEIWDMLQHRYVSSDLSHRYQLRSTLHNMLQDVGESVLDFYARMRSLWDQLAASEPSWDTLIDAQKFQNYRNEDRLIQFLMALRVDFEPTRASLLHIMPLPTIDQALAQLVSEETRLGLRKTQGTDAVMAVSTKSSGSTSRGTTSARTFRGECFYCKKYGHHSSDCHK